MERRAYPSDRSDAEYARPARHLPAPTAPDRDTLTAEGAAWEVARNTERATIQWGFTIDDARTELSRLYPASVKLASEGARRHLQRYARSHARDDCGAEPRPIGRLRPAVWNSAIRGQPGIGLAGSAEGQLSLITSSPHRAEAQDESASPART